MVLAFQKIALEFYLNYIESLLDGAKIASPVFESLCDYRGRALVSPPLRPHPSSQGLGSSLWTLGLREGDPGQSQACWRSVVPSPVVLR